MKKKLKKNKNFNPDQRSFFFEDYLETNKRNKSSEKVIIFKIEFIFFFFIFSLIFILVLEFTCFFEQNWDIQQREIHPKFTLLRRDIVDRNGVLISRNIKSFHQLLILN